MMHMTKLTSGLLLALSLAGCSDWLTGPGLTISPNSPVKASKEQLFGAVQASQESQEEGNLARWAAMFTQQMAGVGRQHATQVHEAARLREGGLERLHGQVEDRRQRPRDAPARARCSAAPSRKAGRR